jgi:hypothetical protein
MVVQPGEGIDQSLEGKREQLDCGTFGEHHLLDFDGFFPTGEPFRSAIKIRTNSS